MEELEKYFLNSLEFNSAFKGHNLNFDLSLHLLQYVTYSKFTL